MTTAAATLEQKPIFDDHGYWMSTWDGDPRAFALFSRHYSFYQYKDNRRNDPTYRNRYKITGPGEPLILLGRDMQALCCWRRYHDASSGGQKRLYCTCYRNESVYRASDLLLEAMALAWRVWPGEDLYTYVDPAKVQTRSNPGWCFLVCGWRREGFTREGKLILRADYRLMFLLMEP